ncbi:protein of unknown function [Shewanella benthica]|uniref:Uncharacterized protein n=1 Tax=Shewanella benthica TaxID=43661 RepID=A0A330M2J3_9GAMM|nr:protein of unknown function [Shewanella benthica]
MCTIYLHIGHKSTFLIKEAKYTVKIVNYQTLFTLSIIANISQKYVDKPVKLEGGNAFGACLYYDTADLSLKKTLLKKMSKFNGLIFILY